MLTCCCGERRVICVDIGYLDVDKALCVGRRRAKSFTE